MGKHRSNPQSTHNTHYKKTHEKIILTCWDEVYLQANDLIHWSRSCIISTDGLLFIWKTIWVRCGWWCAWTRARELPMLYEWFDCSLCRCVRVRDSVDGAHNCPPACWLLLPRSRRIRTFLCMFTLYQNKIRKNESVCTCECVLMSSKRNEWLGELCISA